MEAELLALVTRFIVLLAGSGKKALLGVVDQ
jgi:hypothetical protein